VLLSAAHRFLATRVIDQAVRDVRNPNGAPIDNVSARAFLSGSPMLSYWCEIAGLDPNCVIDRARILLASCETCTRSQDNPILVRVLPPVRVTSGY
jgi:hypothetical protein